ncbi:MAG: DUF4139 domain-containing protein [Gemmatimonadales bacterium]
MTVAPRLVLVALVGATPLCAQARSQTADARQTGITVYQDGRVLNRTVFPVRVPAGRSTHQLALGSIDPASLFALDAEVAVVGAQYDPAVAEADAIRRLVGRPLQFLQFGGRDTTVVTATVLGVDPERYQLANGRVIFQRPGLPAFPAELAPPDARLSVAVASDRARSGLGLGYFTSGASWNASYSLIVNRGSARITGVAAVTAGTLRADSVDVQLLAGNVGQAAPQPMFRRNALDARVAMAAEAVAVEERVGEAHLYTLPGRHHFEPGLVTVASLFEPTTAPVERVYTISGQVPFYGGLPQTGSEDEVPVAVTYVVKRTARTGFGDTPVPGGTARLYERDSGGRPQLIGEAAIGHTAAGQDLRLSAGTAFDLTAERTQSEYQTQRVNNRTVATAAYEVTVSNAGDSTATVDVLETRGGEWSVVSSSVPAEKLSSTQTRFRVRVPARGEARLTYRIRVVW